MTLALLEGARLASAAARKLRSSCFRGGTNFSRRAGGTRGRGLAHRKKYLLTYLLTKACYMKCEVRCVGRRSSDGLYRGGGWGGEHTGTGRGDVGRGDVVVELRKKSHAGNTFYQPSYPTKCPRGVARNKIENARGLSINDQPTAPHVARVSPPTNVFCAHQACSVRPLNRAASPAPRPRGSTCSRSRTCAAAPQRRRSARAPSSCKRGRCTGRPPTS